MKLKNKKIKKSRQVYPSAGRKYCPFQIWLGFEVNASIWNWWRSKVLINLGTFKMQIQSGIPMQNFQ